MTGADISGLAGMGWDQRHDAIERVLLDHFGRTPGMVVQFEDPSERWVAVDAMRGGASVDITELAADINVALGPPPDSA